MCEWVIRVPAGETIDLNVTSFHLEGYNAPCYYDHLEVGINPFIPTVPSFAVRKTDVSRHNGRTSGAPLKPLRDPHYAERRQSLGQQMLERWA